MNSMGRWAEIRRAVTDAVLSSPTGISHRQLEDDLQACGKAITRHLRALQAEGLVGYIGGCESPVWVNAKDVFALAAAGAAARKDARRKRRSAQRARARDRKRAGLPAPVLMKRAARNIAAQWAIDIDKALLTLPDGATSQEIARRMGRHVQSVKKYLRTAHTAGRCVQVRMGKCGALWAHIDYAARMAALRQAHDEVVQARKLAARRTAERLAKGEADEEATNNFERPSVKLWRDASTAPPIRVKGPNSVFALAVRA